jgi:hypothetical protein
MSAKRSICISSMSAMRRKARLGHFPMRITSTGENPYDCMHLSATVTFPRHRHAMEAVRATKVGCEVSVTVCDNCRGAAGDACPCKNATRQSSPRPRIARTAKTVPRAHKYSGASVTRMSGDSQDWSRCQRKWLTSKIAGAASRQQSHGGPSVSGSIAALPAAADHSATATHYTCIHT